MEDKSCFETDEDIAHCLPLSSPKEKEPKKPQEKTLVRLWGKKGKNRHNL